MKGVLRENKNSVKKNSSYGDFNEEEDDKFTLPPINNKLYKKTNNNNIQNVSSIPTLPPINGSVYSSTSAFHSNQSENIFDDSFYLNGMNNEDLPQSITGPFAKVLNIDPTAKASNYKGALYHGGYFDPRNIKSNGIPPFKNAMENYNNSQYKDMYSYIDSAQARRVNGTVKEDPLHSCTRDPKQAIKFAPRASTNGKIPHGIIKKLKEIYANKERSSFRSKTGTTVFYDAGKAKNVGIDITIQWGPFSEVVINKLIEMAAESLAEDVFGPCVGYVAAIDTERGHSVTYDSRMGNHGSIKKDYTEEQEVNLFGGIRGVETKGFLPVWGKYMNPTNNIVVHTQDSGSIALDNAAKQQCQYNKLMLRSSKYDKLTKWKKHAQSFGSMLLYKNLLSSVKQIFTSKTLEISVVNGIGENNIVAIKSRGKIPGVGVVCDVVITVDKRDLSPGDYTLTCNDEQLEDNELAFKEMSMANINSLEQIKNDVEAGISQFIDEFEKLAEYIPRDIF